MHNEVNEKEMRFAFKEKADEVLCQADSFEKRIGTLRVGFESEVGIWKDNVPYYEIGVIRDKVVDRVKSVYGGEADVELGLTQLELRTAPYDILSDFEALDREYRKEFERNRFLAGNFGASILRIGSNPLLPVIDTPRTDKLKYQLVPDYQNMYRRKTITTTIGINGKVIEIGDASIVSLFQSFQVNLEAKSLDDAIAKMNRSFMFAPYLMAIGGNSRYLGLQDTGWNDLRIVAWELSHDTRTSDDIKRGMGLRIGLPEKYFEDMTDYFERILKYPFILHDPEHAFKIGIGLHWLDTRVKFIGNSAVVELRALPTQPTIENELALTLFYIGRLIYAEATNEPFLPMVIVRENRLSSLMFGLAKPLWVAESGKYIKVDARDAVRRELSRAGFGLKTVGLGCHIDILESLYSRIDNGSPSDVLSRHFDNCSSVCKEEMLEALKITGMLV